MAWLKNLTSRLRFGETLTGLLFDPFYIARRGLFKLVSKHGGHIHGDVLDVGCGSKPYQQLFRSTSYTGIEVCQDEKTTDKPDCYYDGKQFPFRSESFNSVVCSQVLEHVFDPDIFLREIARVLARGGKALITVPFVWNEHEQPYDYARYSSFGLAHLLMGNGFELVAQDKSSGGLAVTCQLANAYFYELFASRARFVRWLAHILLMLPLSVFGLLCQMLLPASDSLYLDNIIVVRKKGPDNA